MEKGATLIGFDEFTIIGSKGGISPSEFTVKTFPFSNMIWLCMFPFCAVRWYSSLVVSLSLRRGSFITFEL